MVKTSAGPWAVAQQFGGLYSAVGQAVYDDGDVLANAILTLFLEIKKIVFFHIACFNNWLLNMYYLGNEQYTYIYLPIVQFYRLY